MQLGEEAASRSLQIMREKKTQTVEREFVFERAYKKVRSLRKRRLKRDLTPEESRKLRKSVAKQCGYVFEIVEILKEEEQKVEDSRGGNSMSFEILSRRIAQQDETISILMEKFEVSDVLSSCANEVKAEEFEFNHTDEYVLIDFDKNCRLSLCDGGKTCICSNCQDKAPTYSDISITVEIPSTSQRIVEKMTSYIEIAGYFKRLIEFKNEFETQCCDICYEKRIDYLMLKDQRILISLERYLSPKILKLTRVWKILCQENGWRKCIPR